MVEIQLDTTDSQRCSGGGDHRNWYMVEPGGRQDWWRQGGDHGDWLVARWRPRRRQSQAEFTEAGRTRWRPQKGNHKEVDYLSTGLVVGTLVAE